GLVLRDPMLLLATRFVVGFAAACMVTTCVWVISAQYQGDRRARVLGISTALSHVASLCGNLLGGYLAQRAGWPMAFVLYPAFSAAGLLLTIGSLRQIKPEGESASAPPVLKRLLPFYLLAVFLFAVMFMGSTQFAFLLDENGIKSPATRSLIMGTITVVGTLMSFGYGPVQQRLGVLGAFALGLFSMALSLVAIGAATSAAASVLGAGLMGVYIGLVVPYVYHAVTERTDPFTRSRAIGLLGAFSFLGGFLNPLVFATLGRVIGLRNVFLIVGLVMALLAVGTTTTLLRRRTVAGAQGPDAQERVADSRM
ncbi:MAG: MFS transporter, partial [Sinobacteraceae bacterium]|nr:MFS transporter [Nevskiaceae bacterium]